MGRHGVWVWECDEMDPKEAVNYLWRVEVSLAELGRCPHGCDDVDAVALP